MQNGTIRSQDFRSIFDLAFGSHKISIQKYPTGLNHFCKDFSCVSDVRSLGKWKPEKIDQRPRPLLLSLTNSWTVRQI